jgi:hypothetical protein
MSMRWFVRSLALLVLFLQGCCAGAPAARPGTVDLSALFQLQSEAARGDVEESFRRDVPVERAGQERRSLVLIAPVAVAARLPAIAGVVTLTCITAPVFNIGDGFEFEVAIRRRGARDVVFRRYYDPAREVADRDWVPLSVAFRADGEGDLELEMQVSGGPQGDLITDWLAVASPCLVLDRRSK